MYAGPTRCSRRRCWSLTTSQALQNMTCMRALVLATSLSSGRSLFHQCCVCSCKHCHHHHLRDHQSRVVKVAWSSKSQASSPFSSCAEKIQKAFEDAIKRTSKKGVQAFVFLSTDSGDKHKQFVDMKYRDLCKHLNDKHFMPCVRSVYERLWEVRVMKTRTRMW